MHISFTFKGFEPSEHLRKYTRRRLEKLTRFINKNAEINTQVIMSIDKFRQKIEVQISGEGHPISAHETTDDMYTSVDLVLDKLESQIKRSSDKLRSHRHKEKASFAEEELMPKKEQHIQKIETISFLPKPLSIAEAMLQIEKSDLEFFVFLNAETNRINILYFKKNGNMGLIDPAI